MTSVSPTALGSIETLYVDHHSWLRAILYRRLGCRTDAADLAHDTFIRLLKNPRQFNNDDGARKYLGTVAKGLCIDLWRRRDIQNAWLEAMSAMERPVHASEEDYLLVVDALLAFDAMLHQLPEKVANAYIMSQVEGMTYREISVRLDVSERTIKKYMAKAVLHCALYIESERE